MLEFQADTKMYLFFIGEDVLFIIDQLIYFQTQKKSVFFLFYVPEKK